MAKALAIRRLAFAAVALSGVSSAVSACQREPLVFEVERPSAVPEPLLPSEPGAFAPAFVAVDGAVTGSWLAGIESCAGCHADVFAQQQASAHAWSSFNNPIYRFSVEALREAVGFDASKMCAGCHDIALLVDGAMDSAVTADDPRAHAGVTCLVCHGMSEATVDGNGSFTLSRDKITLPKTGDAASLAAHKASAAPIRGPGGPGGPGEEAMCGSCHRGFLSRATGNSHFLPGMDELTGHAQSAYAGGGLGRVDAVEKKSCIDCHMAKEPATRGDAAAKNGMVSSHRFTGGHTWLAQMIGDEAQLAAQRAQLAAVVSLDIAAAKVGASWSYPAEEAIVSPGEVIELDVVMRNLAVGHRFPAGVLDAQDTFVTIKVTGKDGAVVATSDESRADGEDNRHILRALIADQDGRPRFARDVQHFAAVIVNHTIAPRDAAVVRYRLTLPEGVALPITIESSLVHRSRNTTIAALACAESKSARGIAYDAFETREGRVSPNGCVVPPLTEIARDTLELGGVARSGEVKNDVTKDIDRLYELGLALGHAVSERLEEARAPLEKGLALVGNRAGEVSSGQRARLLAALAIAAGRQGRTDEALELLARAEAEVGKTPALAKLRGDALAKVWRWREAEVAFSHATRGAPGNSAGFRELAIARGSLGDHAGALEASRAGLALSPRDADMLRVQALAVRALGATEAVASEALDAYDTHRPPDRAGDIRISCAKSVPSCALERQPVHTHVIGPP